jgi:asparagine N-glycosylation enzyme membrane subunit Stt3
MNLLHLLKRYKIDVLIVLALFFLAFGIRTMTVDKFPNIYGFDSFWAAKMAKFIVDKGNPWPLNDTTTLYPYGRWSPYPSEGGWWALEAGTYKVAAALSGISGFNYNLFGQVASWLTAVAGALAIPAMYLFGRSAWNRWVGLSTALFLAASGNHLFYSIFGHAENDALGFTLFFLSLSAFVLTVKTKDWRMGLLTTFLFGWLSSTWQSFNVAILLVCGTITLYFLIYYALNQIGYYKNSPERDRERKWMIYALAFALAAIFIHYPFGRGYSALLIGSTGFSILISAAIEIYSRKIKLSRENFFNDRIPILLIISLLALLIGWLLFGTTIVTEPFSYIGINLGGTAPIADYHQRMLTTIAEQNPISGANFLDRLATLAQGGAGITIWLAFMAVIFIFGKLFVMPFVRKDFTWQWDILAVAFILMSMYVLTSRAVTMFFLAGAIAFGAGYLAGELVHLAEYFGKYYKKYKNYAKAAVFVIMILIFFGLNTMIIPSSEGFGYDVYPEWVNLFGWVNQNMARGSVITAWWDYGHWLSYFDGDNISVTTDNAQYAPSIYTTALAFTHTVPCTLDKTTNKFNCDSSPEALEKAEIEALSILKPMGTTHILVDTEIVGGSTGGKFGALETIANNYVGCMQTVGCTKNSDGSAYCLFGKNEAGQDVGLAFSAEEWTSLKTTPWPGTTLTSRGLPARAFARESSGGPVIYMSALSCGQFQPDANSPVLFAFEQRLFFRDPNLKHVKLVYDDQWNVIYEVNWTGIPDPKDSVLPGFKDNLKVLNAKWGT